MKKCSMSAYSDLFSPNHLIKPKQFELLRTSLNGLILPFMLKNEVASQPIIA